MGTTLMIAGVAWSSGTLSFAPLLISSVLANMMGATTAYFIGRHLGQSVILRFGRYIGLTSEKYEAAQSKFEKYGIPLILISKFVIGIRVFVPYLAGINRMPFKMFTFYNAISASIWVSTEILSGRYLGLAWRRYHWIFSEYTFAVSIAIIMVLICLYVMKMGKKKRLFKKTES
ncbi:DedA family protein [Paenibacillus alginolyticus]|uniref:DedA family protein n=1 Tax=Paenibacillus alginolyticus TaxID=59839 RepID=A0ABT4G9V4_9BACL|nr:DedA family protein [Paenibacillus alginolyticus]MCY9692948.1 DedA family protein [Paenibacillus alginolyticus]MEC0144620.1 DedA family protein [Paenibacillus alginolyticus]